MLHRCQRLLVSHVDRLTSAEFHRSVSPEVLSSEIRRLTATFSAKNPTPLVLTEVKILTKYIMSIPGGHRLLRPLITLAHQAYSPAELGSDISLLIDHLIRTGSVDSMIANKDSDSLGELLRACNDVQLRKSLAEIAKYMTRIHRQGSSAIPEGLLRVIPQIESELVGRANLLSTPQAVETAIELVGRLKLANVAVFEAVIGAIMKDNKERVEIKASSVLKLLRELGWAGYCHSGLLERVSPMFTSFLNYQALSSVWLIAGGLDPSIVASCMRTVQRDRSRKSSQHPLTPESHTQLIRRLVVCGYLREAMELFRHFPPSAYTSMRDRNAVSQIHRLFVASFIDPETVPPAEVACLKPDAVAHEATSVVYHQEAVQQGSSFVHSLLVASLTRLGVEHVSEFEDPKSALVIDVFVPQLNLAIEVQGPSHYITDLASGQRRLRPEDEFKIKALRSLGYQVEQVSVYDFGRNFATRNADAKVTEILNKYRP